MFRFFTINTLLVSLICLKFSKNLPLWVWVLCRSVIIINSIIGSIIINKGAFRWVEKYKKYNINDTMVRFSDILTHTIPCIWLVFKWRYHENLFSKGNISIIYPIMLYIFFSLIYLSKYDIEKVYLITNLEKKIYMISHVLGVIFLLLVHK